MAKNKEKIKVAVLAGGNSTEREVSLISGKMVMENLDREKFAASFYDTKTDLDKLLSDYQNQKIDVCFIALHGKGGEDGILQGMLELWKIPYTGSGVLASALGMDKVVSKNLISQKGILTPRFLSFHSSQFGEDDFCQEVKEKIEQGIGYPCVVKPSSGGSSVATFVVENSSELENAVKEAMQKDSKILIEEFIPGTEITIGILGNKVLEILPIVEITPKNKFFDYQAKYDSSFCEEIVPARVSLAIAEKSQEIAQKVYQVLGCSGFSRIDLILKQGEEPYVLEINTIPGLTPNSLLPKAAKAAGISFAQLLEKIIFLAMEKYGQAAKISKEV